LANLIYELAGGEVASDIIDVFPKKPRPVVLDFNYEKFVKFSGFEIKPEEIASIFKKLGFVFDKNLKKCKVKIPTYRRDILIIEDLYEEILRVYGYDKIPSISPKWPLIAASFNENILFKNKISGILTSAGFNEVYNYSFIGEKNVSSKIYLTDINILVELRNPLAEDKKYLRPSLIFNLLKNASDNFRYFDNVRIFEIGKIFYWNKEIKEENKISGLAAFKKLPGKDDLFFEIKGIVETILERNGLDRDDYSFRDNLPLPISAAKLFDLGKNAVLVSGNNAVLGYLGEIKKEVLQYYDINGAVAAFELDFEKLLKEVEEEKEYTPLSIYPSVIRDISLLVDSDIRVDDVLEVIYGAGAKLVEDVDLFDIYIEDSLIEGKRILPQGKKSMAFHIIFQADDHTLTDKEVGEEMGKIIALLKEKLGAEIR